MKTNRMTKIGFILAGAFAIHLTSCAELAAHAMSGLIEGAIDRGIASQAPNQYKVRESKYASVPPKKGMTKSAVLNMYGEPNMKSVSGEGESWTYAFKSDKKATFGQRMTGYGELIEQPKHCFIMFGNNGRVSNFSWN